MNWLANIGFTTPWALAALLLLPLIWWLLRATPPRPQTVKFPPLRLLLKLINREEQPERTPWWLLLLRLALTALVIIAVAHPFYAPARLQAPGKMPLLLIADDGWASADRWDTRRAMMLDVIDTARSAGVPVTIATTAPALHASDLKASDAASAATRAVALEPKALASDRPALLARLKAQFADAPDLRVVWITDGLDSGDAKAFAQGLQALAKGKASVEAIVPPAEDLPMALARPAITSGRVTVTALRVPQSSGQTVTAVARAANGRTLGETALTFAPDKGRAEAAFDMPVELRNEIQGIALERQHNAAAVFLFDDRWRRKSVALQTGATLDSAQPLLSPLYYVSRAIEPFVEQSQPADQAALKQSLDQGLSMLVLADIGVLPPETQVMVKNWVDRGGLLLRFAGPRLAGAATGDDTLLPVTLREGGRSLDSALSWEEPQPMQDFAAKSPFTGLALDPTVRISRQVLAEPDVDLPDRVWAALADGTPLVTARHEGKGLIVLFHVTANADWSNLPLSGLFVEMLRRVLDLAPAAGGGNAALAGGEGQAFVPSHLLNGAGELTDPSPDIQPISAAAIDTATATAETPPGLYRRGGAERALNLSQSGDGLAAITDWPQGVTVHGLTPERPTPLAPYLFAAAFLFFLLDCLAALWVSGGLSRLRASHALPAIILLALINLPPPAHADPAEDFALKSVLDTHLAYVVTGDQAIDQVSEQGLKGLSAILRDRTSVDAADPIGVNVDTDELVFFPLLYWPIRPDAPDLPDATLAKVATYMKNGGTIFFDLREDGADALAGGVSPASAALRRMLAKLDIPPLEPVPPEHVLTKSFYLLQNFPGRYDQGQLWVERSDADAAVSTFDGVSSIIIGSNDYAAAWALDDNGSGIYAMIPGGDRQREMAFRTGINIVMYALTGNYKADQVHVPALLERLGQ